MFKKSIYDEEFGEIILRRISNARMIKISLNQRGQLQATMPSLASARQVKSLIDSSRSDLRQIVKSANIRTYQDGMRVGKNHYITVTSGRHLIVSRKSPAIIVTLPASLTIESPKVQAEISKHVKNALRAEAKKYLVKRLEILARQHGYSYNQVRLNHTKTRWGSCTTRGTINLNIALMNLPFELIDYVLIHELCHTKQMNHSKDFWMLVASADPHYKIHRNDIKKHSPII